MTCLESEILMGQGELGAALAEHVRECSECGGAWRELAAHRHIIRAMGLAETVAPVQASPAYPWWKWIPAAAALVTTLAGAWWVSKPTPPPAIVSIDVTVTGFVNPVPMDPAQIPAAVKLSRKKIE